MRRYSNFYEREYRQLEWAPKKKQKARLCVRRTEKILNQKIEVKGE